MIQRQRLCPLHINPKKEKGRELTDSGSAEEQRAEGEYLQKGELRKDGGLPCNTSTHFDILIIRDVQRNYAHR